MAPDREMSSSQAIHAKYSRQGQEVVFSASHGLFGCSVLLLNYSYEPAYSYSDKDNISSHPDQDDMRFYSY
jgi:hypothetical protein